MYAGLEKLEHYEAYVQALKGGMELTLRYLKFLFFGPPRSGKTVTRRRLLREIVNLEQLGLPSKSTGVADVSDIIIKNITKNQEATASKSPEMSKKSDGDVPIKKVTSEQAVIAGSEWQSIVKSKKDHACIDSETNFDYLAQLFYQLIHNQFQDSSSDEDQSSAATTEDEDSDTDTDGSLDEESKRAMDSSSIDDEDNNTDGLPDDEVKRAMDSLPTSTTEHEGGSKLSQSEEMEINNAFKKLTAILKSDSPESLKKLLQDLTMINVTDVGGQPAFLDMLPAFTIGPALYFLIFRLDQDISKRYPVRFLPSEGEEITFQNEKEKELELESDYCIKEVLYQCLSSIDCFSHHQESKLTNIIYRQQGERRDQPQIASSHALLFGTHKDLDVVKGNIEKISESLEKHFTGIANEQQLLLPSAQEKMVCMVDNRFGTDESEMTEIRKHIEFIIKKYFPAVTVPASWLMFRIVLHLLKKSVVSLAQCEQIAKQLSDSSKPLVVKHILWFFHHNTGSLLYYPKIDSMKDVVICNPQVIFDCISKLIIHKFKQKRIYFTPEEYDDLHKKGQFSLSVEEEHTDCQLTPNQLKDLLKSLNILAEIKQDTQSEPKLIMPALMKSASKDELKIDPRAEKKVSRLVIHFDAKFVPFGVFCASVAQLISHQKSLYPKWVLFDDQVRRDKVLFLIDGAFYVSIISQPECIIIHVEKHSIATSQLKLEVICPTVRKTVVKTLENVISEMKYKRYEELSESSKRPFELAFTCSMCKQDPEKNHFMTVSKVPDATCLVSKTNTILKKDHHLIWFEVRTAT